MKRRQALMGTLGAALFLPAGARAQNDLLKVRDGEHILGKPDAPNTIVEYVSFTCWSCARFHLEVLPTVKKRWIDTGKAKLVFRHFPIDNVATRASQLAECGPSAGFFQRADMLFRTQDRWARAADPAAEMAAALASLGVTREQVLACDVNTPVVDKVIESIQVGQTLGVTSTPTLFINGENHGNPGDPKAIDIILRKSGR